jgi:hypothetical protein
MGDPNATATPAALAAVTISRILPEKLWSPLFGGSEMRSYLDYAKIS